MSCFQCKILLKISSSQLQEFCESSTLQDFLRKVKRQVSDKALKKQSQTRKRQKWLEEH